MPLGYHLLLRLKLKHVEDLLGLHHLSMNTANADPMSDVFGLTPDLAPYDPILPASLCKPPVDPNLILDCGNKNVPQSTRLQSLHDGAWWQAATKQFDFSKPDSLDSEAFNRVLWKGVMGEGRRYPVDRSGKDLRIARSELLKSTASK